MSSSLSTKTLSSALLLLHSAGASVCVSVLLTVPLIKVYDSPTGKTTILLLQNTGVVRRRMGLSSCWYGACLITDLDALLSYSSDQWSWWPRRHVLQPNRIPLDSCWKTVLCPRMSSLFCSLTLSLTDIQDLWTHTDNGTVIRNMTVHNVPPHGVVALLLKDAGDEPEGTEPPCARPEWCMDQNGTRIDVWTRLLGPLICIICFPKLRSYFFSDSCVQCHCKHEFGNVIDSRPNKYKLNNLVLGYSMAESAPSAEVRLRYETLKKEIISALPKKRAIDKQLVCEHPSLTHLLWIIWLL